MDKDIMPEVVKIIRELIKPGDIVNVSGAPSWYDIPLHIAYWGIRTAQKGLFGKSSAWRDTHTMIYFADGTFSVEPPRATYVPIEDYAMKEISFYRYTKKGIYKADVEILRKGADQIIGTGYDVGQLLDIAIGQVCGYPVEDKVKIFDTGKKNVVCSVGAAAAIIILSAGLFTKFISDGNFIAGLSIVLGLYQTANVAQKIGGGE